MDFASGDAHLRISDADRAEARRLLERAVGEGMLTLDEFTERLDVVLAARTRGDLAAVFADLPLRVTREVVSAEPTVLRGRMTSVSRRGKWVAPPRIVLDTRICETTLDFRSATLQHPVVAIHVDDYCSTTEIILPDDATANIDAMRAVAGSVTVNVSTAPPSPRLHVVVDGRVRMGSVTVRHAFGAALRRAFR
ncbi:DUF1707 SHOCT-like domain-containing protein [Mycolicibacterium litorale]|uniref:DUF1707 domain-containing protein n=1 Tax=Mycolicibacterium litorale TaxID=758802 RepID=A0AAD1MXB0_9MYCO|nr:DUF1707 domain-containing protein [Mycolicibacterium litorale]MCV7418222.1 DUF1707 domain-containing protein [Mycolicibacterium litorale]BBY19467.1 hypothetical protein MLIT_50590 [Mycolicibacterium litorale]